MEHLRENWKKDKVTKAEKGKRRGGRACCRYKVSDNEEVITPLLDTWPNTWWITSVGLTHLCSPLLFHLISTSAHLSHGFNFIFTHLVYFLIHLWSFFQSTFNFSFFFFFFCVDCQECRRQVSEATHPQSYAPHYLLYIVLRVIFFNTSSWEHTHSSRLSQELEGMLL